MRTCRLPPGWRAPLGRRRRLIASVVACVGACVVGGVAGGATQATEDVPFITTPDNVTVAMLRLADVGPRDRLIDLGSGDGRIVITAARTFGASGLGVEIVPELVVRSRANALQAGVAARAEFREQDLFKTDLSAATVITMYLLPEVNLQLRPALLALRPGTRIVSHDWDMGDWTPDRTLTVDAPDKRIGREKLSRLHLWTVPARAEGLWCAPGGLQWRLGQRHQFVHGNAGPAADLGGVHGRLEGTRLQLQGLDASLSAELQAGRWRVGDTTGRWVTWRGRLFEPGTADRCPN